MRELIFATNNQHKADEIQPVLGDGFKVLTLRESGIDIEIPEPYNSLEENAQTKARTIYQLTGKNCFSEDTALEVNSLNGEPGVKSARYAGDERDAEANTAKLLDRLSGRKDRSGRFRTVIALVLDGQEYLFEGTCEGSIADQPRGKKGFGYDPVFIPRGDNRTFAEMDLTEKNQYSHRSKAIRNLVDFLNSNHP